MPYVGKKATNVVDVSETQSLTVDGDLTVDTNTLHVDSANNNVATGTTSPGFSFGGGFEIERTGSATMGVDNSTASVAGEISAYDASSGMLIYTITAHPIAFGTSGGEKMRLTAGGSLGIGTTAPETPIEIETTNKLGGTFTGTVDGEGLRVTQTDYTSGNFVSLVEAPYDDSNTSANVRIGAMFDGSGSNLCFGTSNSFGSGVTNEAMRIDSSGNLTVGKTSVAIAGNGAIIKPSGEYFATTAGANTYHYYDSSNSRYNFYVLGNGGVANFSANNSNLSDQTEKKNIVMASSAWDDVKALSLKEFHYNFEDDSDPKKLGVIAQDIQVNHPSLVTSFEIDDETTKLGVVEQQLTWMAIKALQEAMAKIETLETKVAALEG